MKFNYYSPLLLLAAPAFGANIEQAMTKDDLQWFNTYNVHIEDGIRNQMDGNSPAGWCINGDQVGEANNICMHYGWRAYKVLGEQKNYVNKKNIGATVGQFEITNCNTKEVAFEHNFSVEVGTEASTTMSVTAGMSVTTSVGLSFEIVEASVETSFHMEASVGHTSTYSDTKTQSVQLSTPIPAGATIKVDFLGTQYEGTIDYEIPVTAKGYIGANMGKRVRGHYYWSLPITSVLNEPWGKKMYGTLKLSSASTDGSYTVHPPTFGRCASLSPNASPQQKKI